MKKYIIVLLTLLCFIPLTVFAKGESKAKVKVYLFESGGCPYCEAETEYLKGLSSYNKKFTIVSKELYVDHIDWEPGKDYELGKKVAETFNSAGFADASYKGTPFVVISDIYAVAGYSTSLESVIEKAYEEGDKDAVSCISKGKDDCVRFNEDATSITPSDGVKEKETETKGGVAVAILAGVALVGVVVYIIKNNKNGKTDNKLEEKEEVVEEAKKTTSAPKKKTNTNKSKNNSKK